MEQNLKSPNPDQFHIMESMRFLLIFRILVPVFFGGLMLYAVEGPYFKLSENAPLVFIGLAVWLIIEIHQCSQWFDFSVGISEDGIQVGNKFIPWKDISVVEGRTASGFSPFIVIHLASGENLSIPAAIAEKYYILGVLQNHVQATEALMTETTYL